MKVIRAWRGLAAHHWIWAVAIGMGVALAQNLEQYFVLFWRPADYILVYVLEKMAMACVFLLGIRALEASRNDPGITAYVFMCVGISAIGAVLHAALRELLAPLQFGYLVTASIDRALVPGFLGSFMPGLLAVLIFVQFRRARSAAAELASVQLASERERASRAQATLDEADHALRPREVAAELRRLAALYPADPAAADGALDRLVHDLRARMGKPAAA